MITPEREDESMPTPLALHVVPRDLRLKPTATPLPRITLGAPAIDLMTDFRRSPIVNVPDSLQIDRALEIMVLAGVRFCFVVDPAGRVVGNVTSYDIQGEKPLRYCQVALGQSLSRGDVRVRDIIEPLDTWQIISFEDARRATVATVVDTFKASGRRHLVVVEGIEDVPTVRGLFSATRFEAETGLRIDVFSVPKTFAEIEQALEHP
jgi:CBS domain-containing protein